MLSGTATRQPVVPVDRYTCEALAEPEEACAHGVAPHVPRASDDDRHLDDAVCLISPLVFEPVHSHLPWGSAQSPEVMILEALAVSSAHRQEPLTICRAPPAPTVKRRSTDWSGMCGSHEPT